MASVESHGNKWRIRYVDRHNKTVTQATPWSLPCQKTLAQNHANYVEAEERFWYEHQTHNTWNFWTQRKRDVHFLYSLLDHKTDLKISDFKILLELASVEYLEPDQAIRTLEKESRSKPKPKPKTPPKRRRLNPRYSYQGETLTLSEWSHQTGISVKTLRMRVARGMSFDKAITTPVMSRKEIGQKYGPRRWNK